MRRYYIKYKPLYTLKNLIAWSEDLEIVVEHIIRMLELNIAESITLSEKWE